MADYRSKPWLYRWLSQTRQHKTSGFTLTEVLVSMIIAGIVITGLLYLVVELLRIDRREIALEQVQRDMQRAIDYIADDLREAVYVYSSPATVTTAIGALDAEIANGAVPVLAFWRPDPVEATLPADCTSEGANSETCELLKTRGATYSLVVYYQEPSDAASAWEGDTTIRRYELAQYPDLDTTGAARYALATGYKDPITDGGSVFETWTPEVTPTADTNKKVLVDYVEDIELAAAPADTVDCRDLIFSLNSPLTGDVDATSDEYNYVLAPADATDQTGFFACIRDPDTPGLFRATQDIYIFLKGDSSTAGNALQPASGNSRFPVLQTQVKLGGVIDRDGE
ncbi:MAG: prepilin-type N-terminal cleavage/methylation domain-containing protein [Cyanobacteria bacterium P01_H01_bin.21]